MDTTTDIWDRAEYAIASGQPLCILTEDEIKMLAGARSVEWYPREPPPAKPREDGAAQHDDMPPPRSARIVRLVNGQHALDLRTLIEERTS